MKRFATGVLIGLLLASLFSAPWMYQAWAVGNCSVFRTWNTGDSVTAGDLNSSFTTAAVTNSTPACLDDYSATVSEMQTTTNPYSGGTESQATSTAGELERLRFMFKQVFGLTQWYRHDQAPSFNNLIGHAVLGALHLSSIQNDSYAARFPVLTGPDHWTGIFWPHATAHMAFTFRDPNHAAGGVQGGIELFRFHAGGLVLHHTVSIMFRHSLASNGGTTHLTALSIDGRTSQIIIGHSTAVLRIHGAGIVGGTNQALLVEADGTIRSGSSAASEPPSPFSLTPMNAVLPNHSFAFPSLAKHQGGLITHFALMYSDVNHQWAHWSIAMPTTATSMTLEIYSTQGNAVAGSVGWHVEAWTVGHNERPSASHAYIFYPTTVGTSPNTLLKQTETLTTSLQGGKVLYLSIRRTNTGSAAVLSQNGFTYATEHTAFRYGILRFQ